MTEIDRHEETGGLAPFRFAINSSKKGTLMLWTIFIVLLLLWALGMVTSTTMGGFIHLLLLIAIVVVLIRIIQGRRVI